MPLRATKSGSRGLPLRWRLRATPLFLVQNRESGLGGGEDGLGLLTVGAGTTHTPTEE